MSNKSSHLSVALRWWENQAGGWSNSLNSASFYVVVILGLGLFYHGWKTQKKRDLTQDFILIQINLNNTLC